MASKYGNLMDEFAQWGTNIKFNTALEEWMEDHCEGTESKMRACAGQSRVNIQYRF